MLDYNKLRTFSVVAEELNVSRAAVKLGRTQSAISQQIKSLEEELDLNLFARRGSKLALTGEGERVFQLARETFAQIDQNMNLIRGLEQNLDGALRIGIPADHCNDFLPEVLSGFLERFPNTRFEIQQIEDHESEKGLIEGSLDFAFITVFRERDLFFRTPVLTFKEYLYASKKYLERIEKKERQRKGIDYLLDLDIIDSNDEMPCLLTWVAKNRPNWVRKLLEKRPSYTVGNHETRKSFVTSHLGAAMVRDYIVERDGKSSNIVKIFPNFKSIQVTVDFAVLKNSNLNPLQSYFVEYMKTRSIR